MAETLLWTYLDWFFTLVILCVVTVIVKIHISMNEKRKILGDMPTYPGFLPIIGHAHLALNFTFSGFIDEMRAVYKEKKKSAYILLGPKVCAYVCSPADIENVFLTNGMNKGILFSFFQSHSSGLVFTPVNRWKPLRKISVTPLAHKEMINSYDATFQEHSSVLLEILKEHEGECLNIFPYIVRCNQDILNGAHFGVNFDIQNNTQLSTQETAANVISSVCERMMKVWLFPDFIYFRTEQGKTMKKCVEHHKQIAKRIIEERKKLLLEEPSTQKDEGNIKLKKLLDACLDPKNGLREEQIMDLIMDLFLVGYEALSIIQSWVLLLLAMYPEHQERVQEELFLLLGDEDEITFQALHRCQYLDMVVKEALRLYGIPAIIRKMDNDVLLENNNTLPANSEVLIGMILVHRDPRYWEHPNSFHPDHFLPENVLNRPKYAFVAFGGGPRKCPAYGYSLHVMKFVLASLLRKYKFTTNQVLENLLLDLTFMYKPCDGYMLKYERHSSSC